MNTKSAIVYLFYQHDERADWVAHSINQLHEHFLSAHGNYPILIYHHASLEGKLKQRILDNCPKDTDVRFIEIDIQAPDRVEEVFQPHKAWDGSRIWGMNDCHAYRWKSGLIYREPSLEEFDQIMFFDTDSCFNSAPQMDPFVRMANEDYKFGYRMLSRDDWRITKFMWETYQQYRAQTGESPKSAFGDVCKMYDYDIYSTQYLEWPSTRMCYYTNWWVMDMAFGNSFEYQSLFRHFDDSGGFYLGRWGDCPVKYLIIKHCLNADRQTYRFEDFAYRHAGYVVEADGSNYCLR